MTARRILLLSLGLNTLAIGALAYYFKTKAEPEASPPLRHDTIELSRQPRAVRHTEVQVFAVTNTLALNWRAIESTDYKEYIARLKAIGCPWETIKDIIIADVSKLYTLKIAALQPPKKEWKFWQVKENNTSAMDGEGRKKFAALHKEKKALLKDLLGIDIDEENKRLFGWGNVWDDQLGFLSAEKRELAKEIQLNYTEMLQEIRQDSQDFIFQDDIAEQKRIGEEKRTELAQILTPQELREYDLRMSDTANQIRWSLRGFEPTQEEFQKIFEARKAFDDEHGDVNDREDKAAYQRRDQARQERDEQIKAALGPQRAAEYQRGIDSDYQILDRIADRFDAPEGSAAQVYDMKKAVEEQMKKLRADETLSAAQRKAALLAIRQETEQAMAAALGERAFKNYKSWNNGWFRNISPKP